MNTVGTGYNVLHWLDKEEHLDSKVIWDYNGCCRQITSICNFNFL